MKTINSELGYRLECYKPKSQWFRGVRLYAYELLGWAESDGIDLLEYWKSHSSADFERLLLKGADSWEHYSYNGWALIPNYDIYKRLCTPSELKKLTRRDGSVRNPNGHENWLDLQARALHQAYVMLCLACRNQL